MTERPRLFCNRPFVTLHVSGFREPKGDAYLCCPSWLNTPVGNLQSQTVEEVWNGPRAQQIRRSILDGSFAFCDATKCPFLQTMSAPVTPVDRLEDEESKRLLEEQVTVVPYGPKEINCSYDRSCNLFCPTCRQEKIVEEHHETQILAIQERLRTEGMRDTESLYITGSGDAFGSPYFNRWLRTMRLSDMPRLKTIHLHTNGLLWTRHRWLRIPEGVRERITSAEISIDAASAETYAINRRGGDFDTLLENLAFVAELRGDGPLRSLKISMVVQENNVHEMVDFVRLGRRFRADIVYFGRLVNWGTFTPSEFRRRAVHRSDHPKHDELLTALAHPVMQDKCVFLGNLTQYTDPQVLEPAEAVVSVRWSNSVSASSSST